MSGDPLRRSALIARGAARALQAAPAGKATILLPLTPSSLSLLVFIGLTRVLSGKGVLARKCHARFKRLVEEGLDRGHLTR